MAPRGAGYRAWTETFLQGRPLNVTDITVGPDGALWIITGGRKTQSALYRIAYSGEEVVAPEPSLHEFLCRNHAAGRIDVRQRPEIGYGMGELAFSAWSEVDSFDPIVRHVGRTTLEHVPVSRWRERALGENKTTASLSLMLALARS